MEETYLGISLDDWFTYHPPVTESRKRAHELVGTYCRKACEDYTYLTDRFESDIMGFVHEVVIQSMITKLFTELYSAAAFGGNAKMFAIQQIRMFANQAITIQELKQERAKQNDRPTKLHRSEASKSLPQLRFQL